MCRVVIESKLTTVSLEDKCTQRNEDQSITNNWLFKYEIDVLKFNACYSFFSRTCW